MHGITKVKHQYIDRATGAVAEERLMANRLIRTLYSPKLEVLSVVIYTMYQEGGFRTLSALTMLQVAIAVVVLIVAKRMTRLDATAEGHAM